MCLLDNVVLWVQALREELLKEVAPPSFFGDAGSSNHDAPDNKMAAALLVLRRLFLLVGDK